MQNSSFKNTFLKYIAQSIEYFSPIHVYGYVISVESNCIIVKNIKANIGDLCIVGNGILAEAIAVKENEVILVPFNKVEKISIGDKVFIKNTYDTNISDALIGRTVNALGEAIDGKGSIAHSNYFISNSSIPNVLERPLIDEQLYTGVKVVDSFIPIGKGQRIGIFSGSGIGKTTLLGMMIRNSSADVNVVCLVGERGREVKELIQYTLGDVGLENTVIINASSHESAPIRIKTVNYALSIAEYFRDKGKDVAFYLDSITRLVHAQREIGLIRGELPASRGYPPSIFPLLADIFERCGTSTAGTITGIFTILVEGGDTDEPISDTVRGLIDGHIHLSRDLADRNHYPAIHISSSLSRLANNIAHKDHKVATNKIRKYLGIYEQSKDIINAGVYERGSNEKLDDFLDIMDEFNSFVQQHIDESFDFSKIQKECIKLAKKLV